MTADDDVPPFRLAALHFSGALVFFAAGAAGLAWQTPALAAGSFSAPGVIAAFHLLTLGTIGTSVMGASIRLLPEALETRLRWEGLGYVSFAAWTSGTAAFAAGMAASRPAAHLFGAGMLGAGALLYAANLWAGLSRAPRRDLTWWCLAGSGLFLLAGWVLGLLLAVNLAEGILGGSRYPVLAVHVHLAAGGWVLLAMIGAGHRLLPRFLGSRAVGVSAGRAAAGLTALGATMLVASEHLLPVGVVRPGLWALAAGALAFAVQGLLHLRGRSRPAGADMVLAVAGLAVLGLAAACGALILAGGPAASGPVTAYGLLLVPGGLALFALGLQGRMVGLAARGGRAPTRGSEGGDPSARGRLAVAGAVLLAGGAPALAAGALTGSTVLAGVASAAYAAGAFLLVARELPPAWRLSRRPAP